MMSFFSIELEYDFYSYLFIFFLIQTGLQLIVTLFVYGRLLFHKSSEENQQTPPVTVLIAARNESDNIFDNLPLILEQEYPEFEVIVINHQSTDDSKYILDAYSRKYAHLKIIDIEKNQHLKYGKKLPLTVGIKGAKYEHLLFTDADCRPSSSQWIKSMASSFSEKSKIVLGYGPLEQTNGFLNKVIRYDTTWIALNYFSFAKIGLPYMGVGRNLGYTKDTFNTINGFRSHYALSSGDDDLFVQEAARKRNYTINVEPRSTVRSDASKTWSEWFKQKARHYTTTDKYKVIKKWMLGIYPLSLLLQLISFVILLLNLNFFKISVLIFSITLIIKWLVLGLNFRKLRETKFIAFIPLWDIFYALLAPIMYYTIDKKDNKKW